MLFKTFRGCSISKDSFTLTQALTEFGKRAVQSYSALFPYVISYLILVIVLSRMLGDVTDICQIRLIFSLRVMYAVCGVIFSWVFFCFFFYYFWFGGLSSVLLLDVGKAVVEERCLALEMENDGVCDDS